MTTLEKTYGARPDDRDDRDYIITDSFAQLEPQLQKLKDQGLAVGIWRPQRMRDGRVTTCNITIYSVEQKANQVIYDNKINDGNSILVPLKPSQIKSDSLQNQISINLPAKYFLHQGYFEKALAFNGVDNYAEFTDIDDLNFSDQDFTIEAWIQVALPQSDLRTGDNSIIEKWEGKPNTGYPYVIRYLNKTGQIVAGRYDLKKQPVVISQTAINDGDFHHVALVKEQDQLYLYIDGKEEASITDTTNFSEYEN